MLRSQLRRLRWIALATPLVLLPAGASAATDDDEPALEEVRVTSTRIPMLIRDSPLRVEAVPAEEIEENLTMEPGNLTRLLNELPGVRVQATASGLGGARLQLRGMPGRHTLVLSDGLPLLGAVPDAFGLLQTPPLDLERVEVIKGAASAMYGGGALGGVLNLVSRAPQAEGALLANATSRGGGDVAGFFTLPGSGRWSGTLTTGLHGQSRTDRDHDGWADLPGYRRWELRPRAWWHDGEERSLFLTSGVMRETRSGGTQPGRVLPGGAAFPIELRTQRLDLGLVAHWALDAADDGQGELGARAALISTELEHRYGAAFIPATQSALFAEVTRSGRSGPHRWVTGVAFEHDRLSVPAVPGVGYASDVPAAFVADDVALRPWLTLAGNLRVDAHSDYGTFVSPRASALLRVPGQDWSLRASVGSGFAAPTPYVDDIDAVGLGRLRPLRALHAERAVTTSLDARWSDDGWDVNASVFSAVIHDPLAVRGSAATGLDLVNLPGARRVAGGEVLVGYVAGPLHAIASWSQLDATEVDVAGVRRRAVLVPRHSGEIGAILENERRGRIGLELGYTGPVPLADDPYRSASRGWFELNALAELRWHGVGVFFNAINLTDVRQGQHSPLLRPSIGSNGNPATEVWAPLAGRTFNLGIRVEL